MLELCFFFLIAAEESAEKSDFDFPVVNQAYFERPPLIALADHSFIKCISLAKHPKNQIRGRDGGFARGYEPKWLNSKLFFLEFLHSLTLEGLHQHGEMACEIGLLLL